MIDLNGKVAVVTGGAQGIGRAIAEALAGQGANVVVADLQEEKAEATAKDLTASTGQRAIAVKVDVADSTSAKAMIDRAIDEFGHVDILVNNAGTTRDNLIMRMSEADWDLILNINLKGAFNCQGRRPPNDEATFRSYHQYLLSLGIGGPGGPDKLLIFQGRPHWSHKGPG
jgi:3-oxoacyl-[acyl-carrier protein] reductase